tara:strand:+ start:14593 stop:15243 length:651 start_codon:yes stop_codon:yes gene_type:complete
MSIARDISRQSSKQNATLTEDQTAVTVTGGFSGSSIQVYLNGVKIIQGEDYSLNGTSGITLTQGASAGDIIEFVMRNTSNSGFSAANTGQIVDNAVTFDKLSNSSTESENVQSRVAFAWLEMDCSQVSSEDKIQASYNISSIVDNGVGNFQVSFNTDPPDQHYCAQVTTNGRVNTHHTHGYVTNSSTSSAVQVTVFRDEGSSFRADPEKLSLLIFR